MTNPLRRQYQPADARFRPEDEEVRDIAVDVRTMLLHTSLEAVRRATNDMGKAVSGASRIIEMFNTQPIRQVGGTATMSPEVSDRLKLVRDGSLLGDLRRDPTPQEITASLDAMTTSQVETTAPLTVEQMPTPAEGLTEDQFREAQLRLAREQLEKLANDQFSIAA